ncbi:MAG TPA: hypothetical protein VMC09_06780 [Anaerolineales bacterium]|nr:hypothetical protein [Anaerolineales bacterium]
MKRNKHFAIVAILFGALMACTLPSLGGQHLFVTLSPAAGETADAASLRQAGDTIGKRLNKNGISSRTILLGKQIVVVMPPTTNYTTVLPLLTEEGRITFVDSINSLLVGSDISSDLPVILTNEDIKSATVEDGSQVNAGPGFIIVIYFNEAGAKKLADYSRTNVGHYLVIARDGRVISSPYVNTAITGGSAIIQGNLTEQSAQELAAFISTESLPFPMQDTNHETK